MGGIVAGTFGVGILAIGTVGVIGVPVQKHPVRGSPPVGGLIPVNPGSVNDICPKQTANCTKCKQPKQSVHADIFFPVQRLIALARSFIMPLVGCFYFVRFVLSTGIVTAHWTVYWSCVR